MMDRFRKGICWVFGCRYLVVAEYRDEYDRPSSVSLYCTRCDSFHGVNL